MSIADTAVPTTNRQLVQDCRSRCNVVSAFAVARLIQSLLYGVGSTEPTVIAAAIVAIGAVVLVASYFPARRATRITPLAAIRMP